MKQPAPGGALASLYTACIAQFQASVSSALSQTQITNFSKLTAGLVPISSHLSDSTLLADTQTNTINNPFLTLYLLLHT